MATVAVTPAESLLTPMGAIPANVPLQDPQIAMVLTGLLSLLNYWTGRVTTLVNSLYNSLYSFLPITCGPVSGASQVPHVRLQAFRGALTAQTAVQTDDLIGAINTTGADGTTTADVTAISGLIQFKAVENWTATAHGTACNIEVTAPGTLNLITSATFKGTGSFIFGTTTNDSAPSGYVGEIISQQIFGGSAIGIAGNNTPGNLAAITLTPGDWDVDGNVFLFPNANASLVYVLMGTNVTSATVPDGSVASQITLSGTGNIGLSCVTQRVSVAVNTNVYLVTQFGWNNTAPTPTMCGIIRARRVR